MKKYNVFKSIAFLVCVMTVMCSCSLIEPKPEDTIYKLETAFNNCDVDAILECYEPSVQTMYNGAMEIGGSLLGGIDLKTVVSGLGGFADVFGDQLVDGGMPKIKIIINSQQQVTEEKVLMNLTINFIEGSSAMRESEVMDVYLILIDDEWYISAEEPIL